MVISKVCRDFPKRRKMPLTPLRKAASNVADMSDRSHNWTSKSLE